MLEEKERRANRRKLWTLYPDDGPLRRDLYAKHLSFFAAGALHSQRAMIAANRVGKTWGVGAFETTLHLTGLYPDWWMGRRYEDPGEWWAAGDTSETTRDIVQAALLGGQGDIGTGMIPGDLIVGEPSKRAGVAGAVDTALIKHASGGIARLGFKSYDQGRKKFQGTAKQGVWLDEEPPIEVYEECLLRTMTTQGMMLCTFTPLEGLSDVVLKFLPGMSPVGHAVPNSDVWSIQAEWDDVPHLDEDVKAKLLADIRPHQRDARTKGIPVLGAGAIYPVPESIIVCDPFAIPEHWPRAYGLDVGWKRTAAVWGAWDRENDTIYIYAEHYLGEEVPAVHAAAIQSRKRWVPGVIDPASRGRSQNDGTRLISQYVDAGLNLHPADNAVEAGITAVLRRMSTGRLKIFRTCPATIAELRIYRRDEKGRIVKENDHAMDALRYLVMSGMRIAQIEPDEIEEFNMGLRARHERSGVTGY